MRPTTYRVRPWAEASLSLAVLVGLVVYTAAYFRSPYPGFELDTSGSITTVLVQEQTVPALQAGDQLLQVGTVTWEDFKQRQQPLFASTLPGQTVTLRIVRAGQTLDVPWVMPALSPEAIRSRAVNIWLVAFVFWLAGTVTLLGLRPRDTRWRLLVAFNFLTAIWVVAGTLSPSRLLASYVERTAASLDQPALISLIREQVLTTLLVQQSALVQLDALGQLHALYADNVAPGELPLTRDVLDLKNAMGRYRPATDGREPCGWARLVLPLALDGRLSGFWLLGRRPPDDYYALAEVESLRSLAQHTAIALSHIAQTERLRRLYQANINQRETERTRLARELHDDVLSSLPNLMARLEDPALNDTLVGLQAIVERIRNTVSDLRPAVLDHGLWHALAHLGDQLGDDAPGDLDVRMDIQQSDARYEAQSEQHLYRIVQQACDNALAYARAHIVRIHGELGADQVKLSVEDDGTGFALDPALSVEPQLSLLVQSGHYGLAGMMERAHLIAAELQFDSTPGQGTRVRITWRPEKLTGILPGG